MRTFGEYEKIMARFLTVTMPSFNWEWVDGTSNTVFFGGDGNPITNFLLYPPVN